MKIPRSLTVNGERWRVVMKPLAKQDLNGLCVYTKRQIWIDSELTEEEQAETFVHELLHACLLEEWPRRREEFMVKRLAPRLLSTLANLGWVR